MVFQLDLATVGLLVGPPRAQGDQADDDECEQAASNARPQTWPIVGLVLGSGYSQ
jgi:hypothetical protein